MLLRAKHTRRQYTIGTRGFIESAALLNRNVAAVGVCCGPPIKQIYSTHRTSHTLSINFSLPNETSTTVKRGCTLAVSTTRFSEGSPESDDQPFVVPMASQPNIVRSPSFLGQTNKHTTVTTYKLLFKTCNPPPFLTPTKVEVGLVAWTTGYPSLETSAYDLRACVGHTLTGQTRSLTPTQASACAQKLFERIVICVRRRNNADQQDPSRGCRGGPVSRRPWAELYVPILRPAPRHPLSAAS